MLTAEQRAWNVRIRAGTASRNDPHGVYDMFGNPKEHVDMDAVEIAIQEVKEGKREHYLLGKDYHSEFERFKRNRL
jgi:hypothetical protein